MSCQQSAISSQHTTRYKRVSVCLQLAGNIDAFFLYEPEPVEGNSSAFSASLREVF